MSTGKQPNWNLCIKGESDTRWRKVGVAWTSEKGNISIRLDRGERGPDWTKEGVMLFPYREKHGWGASRKATGDHTDQKRAERKLMRLPEAPPNYDGDACLDPEPPSWLE